MIGMTHFLFPPLEKGRVVAEGDRVGIIFSKTPTRRASGVDLPLRGGGKESV